MDFDHPPADPVEQFHRWFAEAAERGKTPNPHAMTLATVDADGRPAARIVLLKQFDSDGAVFFTNYQSAKGEALAAHPRAELLFFWDHLDRQVRMSGPVMKVSPAESDAYFATRPRGSQIGAWASAQSQPVDSRAALEQQFNQTQERFGDGPVPRPAHWGGYRVAVQQVEFWQGQVNRLHDRVVYIKQTDGSWTAQRLQP
jgi:pyridoxamine 5'-phosphate oxidase